MHLAVGVYFGSFNPFTPNHLSIALHALTFLDIVYLVANPQNPSKTDMLPLDVRLDAIHERLQQRDMHSHRNLRLFDATGRNLDWAGRSHVCQDIIRDLKRERVARVDMHQLIGSDSFNMRGCQEALAQDDILRGLKRKLVIYMRLSESPLIIPGHLAGIVQVPNFRDRLTNSSTLMREKLRRGETPEFEELHPSVCNFVRRHYQEDPKKRKREKEVMTVLISGGPGSGKTTLAENLARETGGICFSVGDIFRIGKEHRIARWPTAGTRADDPAWKWFETISNQCMQELMDQHPDCHLFVDGLSAENPAKAIDATGRIITAIVDIDCDKHTLIHRMAERKRPGETKPDERERRAQRYLARHWARQRVFDELHREFQTIYLKGTTGKDAQVDEVIRKLELARVTGGSVKITKEDIGDALVRLTKNSPARGKPAPTPEPAPARLASSVIIPQGSSLHPTRWDGSAWPAANGDTLGRPPGHTSTGSCSSRNAQAPSRSSSSRSSSPRTDASPDYGDSPGYSGCSPAYSPTSQSYTTENARQYSPTHTAHVSTSPAYSPTSPTASPKQFSPTRSPSPPTPAVVVVVAAVAAVAAVALEPAPAATPSPVRPLEVDPPTEADQESDNDYLF